MAITINASTSSGLQLASDTSGAISFQKDGTNTLVLPTSGTVTIADGTGTLYAAGPSFSAYQSSAQSALSGSTWTKITLQTEEFDTANCFTNSTFTPNVAGYYQINGNIAMASGSTTNAGCSIYKNGTMYKHGTFVNSNGNTPVSAASAVLYLNGSTDYVELYGYSTASLAPQAQSTLTSLNGSFLRGA